MSPGSALSRLAEQLRGERSVITAHVVEPSLAPSLGPLAAAGPRAAARPAEYSLVVESIREGYELHYGRARVLAGQDPNLSLLAGDYLYALGLERLAAMDDPEAVAELSDLISLCAACHAERTEAALPALWLAAAVAIGCGGGEAHESAKAALRDGNPGAAELLWEEALDTAGRAGLEDALEQVGKSIDFPVPRPADDG